MHQMGNIRLDIFLNSHVPTPQLLAHGVLKLVCQISRRF